MDKSAEMNLFSRAEALKAAHLASYDEERRRAAAKLEAMYEAFYAEHRTDDMLTLRCNYLDMFADEFPVTIFDGEVIVGADFHYIGMRRQWPILIHNGGHFIADFGTVLRQGILGLLGKVKKIDAGDKIKRANRTAFRRALSALSRYILRYSEEAGRLAKAAEGENRTRLLAIRDDCALIAKAPPETFRQALQLVWFAQIFLETEAVCSAVSFGRIDRYLYPYYEKDIACGRLTEEEALFLIMCFYIKTSEGDESQIATLGGEDEHGNNSENRLSVLFLRAQTYIHMRQPSLAVRVRPDSSGEYLGAAAALTALGSGMPAYFNDALIERSLELSSIDGDSARDYGIVGCYESSPQGAFSNTVAGGFNLYDGFGEFLNTARGTEFADFGAFTDAYKKYFDGYYVRTVLPAFRGYLKKCLSWRSPFLGCCLKGCLERGLMPEQFGCDYSMFGVNVLGIGILIDSLYTVKKLVFEQKSVTLAELCDAAADNFSDAEIFEKIKSFGGTYGSDSEETDRLAEELSVYVAGVLRAHPVHERMLVMPALFWFGADISRREYAATLNGRRKGELLSYGVSPCATPHTNPMTSVLRSAAHIRGELFPDGCPMMVSFPSRDLKDGAFVKAVVNAYFDCGGFHLAINGVDPQTLEEAVREPESHRDILVKISGFSTQFVGLNKAQQAAVIRRAKDGI